MKLFLAITILLPLCFSSVSATFFPNISSIPLSLIDKISHDAWDAFKNLTGCRPGNKTDGLSKLKKYFNHFGYIPNLPANFTDDFDDELEAAIRTYQRNFNLNVTGELDDQTVGQLIRPRCGVADIVNGTTSMGCLEFVGVSELFTVVADKPLPILHRLDRLHLLLEFLEKRHHMSSSFGPLTTEEIGKWSYKTLSSALDEVGRKGSIIERLQLIENRVLQLLTVELDASLRSSSPATTPLKPNFNRGDLASVQVNQEVTRETEKKDISRRPKMKAAVAEVFRRKRIGCFLMGSSQC